MIWPVIAAAAGSVLSGALQSRSARKAAAVQAEASRQAAEAQERATREARGEWDAATADSLSAQRDALARYVDMQQGAIDSALGGQRNALEAILAGQQPYRQAGSDAISQLRALANFDPTPTAAAVMTEPGYEFGRTQGLDAVQGSAAAAGGLYSGRALKELTRFGNDYATTKYGDAFARAQNAFGNRWGRIAALAGMGQAAEGAAGSAQQTYANNAGNLVTGNANDVGNAVLGAAGNETALRTNRANAVGNMAVGAANNLGNIWTNNANAQAGANLQQGRIWGNALSELAGMAGYAAQQWPSGSAWRPQTFGPTWQQQGGPMDMDAYGGYGYMGGP